MANKESRYAKKRKRGRMLYGPGCCAHDRTPEQMRSIRTAAGTLRPGAHYVTTVEQEIGK